MVSERMFKREYKVMFLYIILSWTHIMTSYVKVTLFLSAYHGSSTKNNALKLKIPVKLVANYGRYHSLFFRNTGIRFGNVLVGNDSPCINSLSPVRVFDTLCTYYRYSIEFLYTHIVYSKTYFYLLFWTFYRKLACLVNRNNVWDCIHITGHLTVFHFKFM